MRVLPHISDRDSLASTLLAAGPALDQPETAARQVESDIVKLTEQRDLRRADAIQAVLRARAHEGRVEQPVTSHDAAICWNIAALLHAAAGQPEGAAMTAVVRGAPAVAATSSERVVDPRVEAGLAASAEKTDV